MQCHREGGGTLNIGARWTTHIFSWIRQIWIYCFYSVQTDLKGMNFDHIFLLWLPYCELYMQKYNLKGQRLSHENCVHRAFETTWIERQNLSSDKTLLTHWATESSSCNCWFQHTERTMSIFVQKFKTGHAHGTGSTYPICHVDFIMEFLSIILSLSLSYWY